MKYILGIQTCIMPNSLALIDEEGKELILTELKMKKNTVENLARYLKKSLKEIDIEVKDIDLVSVCLGPGSFTGTRGGLAFAKGLCQFTNIPLVGISAFENLKFKAEGVKDFLIIMDAKCDRVYYLGGRAERIRVDTLDNVLEEVDKSTLLFGPGVRVYKEKILEELGKEASSSDDNLDDLNASDVARAGFKKYGDNPSMFSKEHLLKVKPLYILPPKITKSKK